jgi:hypothetical protein
MLPKKNGLVDELWEIKRWRVAADRNSEVLLTIPAARKK